MKKGISEDSLHPVSSSKTADFFAGDVAAVKESSFCDRLRESASDTITHVVRCPDPKMMV